MTRGLVALDGAVAVSSTSQAQGGDAVTRVDFEAADVGAVPVGITTALTGSGGPVAWTIVEDPTAPARSKVLAQTSTDKTDYRFPLAVAGANANVPSGKWQELRLLARGGRFEVFLDGKSLYSATDTTLPAAGRVALWTKADSVTHFDDLRIQTF